MKEASVLTEIVLIFSKNNEIKIVNNDKKLCRNKIKTIFMHIKLIILVQIK